MDERKIDKHKGIASENRLKQEFERLELHQSSNLLTLEKEKEHLKSELRDLKHSSGYHEARTRKSSTMSVRGASIRSGKVRRLFKNQGGSKISLSSSFDGALLERNGSSLDYGSFKSKGQHSPQSKRNKSGSSSISNLSPSKSLPQLVGMEKKVPERLPEIQSIAPTLTVKGLSEVNSNKSKRTFRNSIGSIAEDDVQSDDKVWNDNEMVEGRPRTLSTSESPKLLRPESRNLSKSEQSLSTAWYNHIDQARSNVHKRLSNSMVTLETESENGSKKDASVVDTSLDMSAFLYAPPDGLPRTMYMMPSEEERFSQARQARYIRKPGTKLNPVEKELDLDDIFRGLGKNSDN